MKKKANILIVWLLIMALLSGCKNGYPNVYENVDPGILKVENSAISLEEGSSMAMEEFPVYEGSPFAQINGNVPYFEKMEFQAGSFETYSELDALGRCQVAYANIGMDLMPTEKRESISQIKPTGWQTIKYDCVDGKYLYNRCHLIGYQLTGENANEKNLITGTRYMNVDGMLPFENMIADYINETGNHVLYRVTPIFEGSDLVARGVTMEAESVEDDGEGILFNVFVYNVQPGVVIDYATGNSKLTSEMENSSPGDGKEYILNTNSMKIHDPACQSAEKISEKNKEVFYGQIEELIQNGYEPCKSCLP